MSRHHYVRVGNLGHVGRFTAVDAVSYPRGARVIVRTRRGLETGEVLSHAGEMQPDERGQSDGSILRGMTIEDQLLAARLEQKKHAALVACEELLRDQGSAATLLDVEHLFDGGALYFHFLGDVPPEIEAMTAELAAAYDAQAQISRFGETLEHGCGPGCGTEAAAGQGNCQSCATGCAIAGACGVGQKK